MKYPAMILCFALALSACSFAHTGPDTDIEMKNHMSEDTTRKPAVYNRNSTEKVKISDEDWKKMLDPEVYYIARQKGTERPWTSKFEGFKEKGTYYCAACGNPLFVSDTKFESGCGWPSFYAPISKTSIINAVDRSHGMVRTEVMCGRCEAHLGHVFDDGPPPTGLRYCINGVILDFEKAKSAEEQYQKKNGQ